MPGLISFTEGFFKSIIWVFALLIVGYFILNFMKKSSLLSGFAGWVEDHAQG